MIGIGLAVALGTVAVAGLSGAEPAPDPDEVPPVGRPTFEEVTDAAGLDTFLHAGWLGSGEPGGETPLFPESMGPGACWLDADDDGWMDLFLVNGLYLTEPEKNDDQDPRSALYSNNGDGTFTETSEAAGLDLFGVYQGCAAADYNNDGDPDIFVTGYGGNVLLENQGDGSFQNVTSQAGVRSATCGDFPCWTTSASWLDADRDGCLDLYVDHFTDYDIDDPPEFNEPGPGQVNTFFHNQCDGTFEDATDEVGLAAEKSDSWSSVAADYNGDGWPDIYVSNDGDENDLYLNDGDGTFTRQSSVVSDPRAGMGTAIGDLDHDGCWEIVTTNFRSEDNGIFTCTATDYEDIGGEDPFTDAYNYSGWGAGFWDLNHDGHEDLLVVNSMTEDSGVVPVDQPILLYENIDGDSFRSIREDVGDDILDTWVSRGAAWADYDNDGDLDVQVSEGGEAPTHLFRADGTGGTFLSLDLASSNPDVNRDAIGATVTVDAEGVPTQHREKVAGSAFMSSSDPRIHVGLLEAESADVTVEWPDGATETFTDLRANTFWHLTQGESEPDAVRQLPIVRLDGPSTGSYKEPLTFTAEVLPASDRSIDDVAWEIEGEKVGQGDTLIHEFADVGTFVVRATATDSEGFSATQATTVHITDQLDAQVLFDKEIYLPTDDITGTVEVTFSDGAPIRGVDVSVSLVRSSGNPTLDAAVLMMPQFMQDALGYETRSFEGTTDEDGKVVFRVPENFESPSPQIPFAMHQPGAYEATADGGARGSTFATATGSYDVGASLPTWAVTGETGVRNR